MYYYPQNFYNKIRKIKEILNYNEISFISYLNFIEISYDIYSINTIFPYNYIIYVPPEYIFKLSMKVLPKYIFNLYIKVICSSRILFITILLLNIPPILYNENYIFYLDVLPEYIIE